MDKSESDTVHDPNERLKREYGYLEQARTLFKQAGDEVLAQLAFAENQDSSDAIGVIRQYVTLIEKGITPPPSVLNSVATAFRRYLDAAGAKSLDHAFELMPKQRAGHPLTHLAEKERRGQIAYSMWCQRRKAKLRGKSISIEKAASAVINEYSLPYDESTLTKNYSSMDADTIFDAALDAMKEALTSKEKQ